MTGEEVPAQAQTVAPFGHMDALPPGTMLGEFEVQSLLGVGGFGMVYRGYDHSLHRAVAIKEYMPTSLVGRAASLQVSARSTADTQSFTSGLASFMAEARLLAQFDHPSLVKVYRVWEDNNTAYMAMPLYSGITLKQARAQMSGPPPEDWLRAVIWSVLEALKILHANGTLHRDVSPDNIFLQDVGPPVLLDLGAARHAVVENSLKHTAILKVNYAPIEQYADAHDLKEGPWTDLYALAAVVHGCLCNEAPLPATFRLVRDRMPTIAAVTKTVDMHFGQSYSSAFVRTIDHALAIQPSNRTKDVESFARELRLRTPKRMAGFDWRAQLEGVLTLGAVVDGSSFQANLPTMPANSIGGMSNSGPSNRYASWLGGVADWVKRHSVHLGLLVLAVLLVVIAVLGGLYRGGVADKSNAPVKLLAPVEVAPPAVEEVLEWVPAPQSPLQPPSSPAFVPVPVAVAASVPVRPSAAVVKPDPRPVTQEIKVLPVPPKALPLVKKPVGPVVDGVVPPPAPAEPQVICPGASLFTRPMCVYRECQKPENANLSVCVEDRKRWESRNRDKTP